LKRRTLDELDLKILKALVENGRLSARKLSEMLNVSVGTIIKRIEKLEQDGIILGYTAIVNHEKLGYDLVSIIEVRVSQGKLLDVENQIAKLPNVYGVYDITGDYDALIIARFKSRKELDNFIKTLLAMPYVERTRTHFVLNVVKEDNRFI
jgi:DNA-binding Lrp family transcriptional regulator